MVNHEKNLKDLEKIYWYNTELADNMKKAYLGLVQYFGEENQEKISSVFRNTNIVLIDYKDKSTDEKIDIRNYILKSYSDLCEEDFREVSIYDDSAFLLKRNESIEGITKTIVLEKNKMVLSHLIYELIRSMLTTDKKYDNGENSYYFKSGFKKYFYSFYIGLQTWESNCHIEEGFATYDTKKICELMGYEFVPKYKHDLYCDYVSHVMEDENLKEIFMKSRLEGIDYIRKMDNSGDKTILFNYVNSYEDNVNRGKYRGSQIALYDIDYLRKRLINQKVLVNEKNNL